VNRIRFITHHGKQILFVDVSNCPPSEIATVARTVPDYVTIEPRSSVLLLVDFTGATFDPEAVRTMKESAVFDKPYIRKSAWIGGRRLEDIHKQLKTFSRRDLPIFSSFEEAAKWLVMD
jgi:hypothetical protein